MISSGMDVPTDEAVDASGNLYVTGKSEGQETGYDYLTVKYNSSGILQWTARYNGPYHGLDIPNAIAVDAAGNVFVTGMSIGSDSVYSDFATVKYNSSGIQQWVQRYNGPANGTDAAYAIEVDHDGNAYVTGVQTNGWTHDFVTIRYNAQGGEDWAAVYDGPDGWDDEATVLALDPAGYIYVSGTSADTVATYPWVRLDCTTIKYDLSGNIVWIQRYNMNNSHDVAPIGVTMDAGGNVCIAANLSSYDLFGRYTDDIVTLKYTPDGVLQWTRIFDSPAFDESLRDIPDVATGIALDADDNIYITGASGEVERHLQAYSSLVTVKYSPDGTRHWVTYYDNPGEAFQSAGIAVDPIGSVYVAGSNGHFAYHWGSGEFVGDSLITLRYDSNGMIQWTRYHSGSAGTAGKGIVLDPAGNIYVAGEYGLPNSSDFLALKYSPSGSESWSRATTGPGNSIAFIADAKVDEQGNIYIAGTGLGTDANQDYVTMKLEPSGGVLWSASYDSPEHFGDYAEAIETDELGNVYVTGHSSQGGVNGWWSSTTIKYSPTGNQEWVARFDTSAMNVIAVDPDGNVYVGGYQSIVKYGPTGVQQWHVAESYSWITALATADSGWIYATVTSSGGADEGFLKKFNPDGVELWSRMTPAAWALALDNSGNAYVSAPVYYPGTGGTRKFTSSGNELWGLDEGGNKIVAAGSDGVYILLATWNPRFLYKIAANGTIEWTQAVNSDIAADFDIDSDGNAYVTTTTFDWNLYTTELITTKYLPTGEVDWSSSYEGSYNANGRAKKVRIDSSGNVYLFMEQEGNDFSAIPVVVKNSHLPAIISSAGEEEPSPNRFELYQNYPNPFNPTTAINFELSTVSFVELKLFDVLGREVRTLVNESLSAGTHRIILDAKGLASGMYFYRLKAAGFSGVKKMIVLR